MLCNQLDAVYTRYRVSNSVDLDDGTRTALQRAMELLAAARSDTRDRKAGRNMDRVMRQTEEILARYGAPPVTESPNGAMTADVPVEAPAEAPVVAEATPPPKRAPRKRAASKVAAETDAVAGGAQRPSGDAPVDTPPTAEPPEKKARSRRRTPPAFPEDGAAPVTEGATASEEVPVSEATPVSEAATVTEAATIPEAPAKRRNAAVIVLAVALVAALAAAGIFIAEWKAKSDSLSSARARLAATQLQLTTAQSNLAAATGQAATDSQSLSQAQAKVRQLQAQVDAAKRQPSTKSAPSGQPTSSTSATNPTVANLQQQLSAAQAQVQLRNNQLLALQACAQDESAVITYQGSGQTASAIQAAQVAQVQCQRANNLGA